MKKTEKPNADHVVCNTQLQVMECLHCKEQTALPLGGLRYACGAMELFLRLHRNCKKPEKTN